MRKRLSLCLTSLFLLILFCVVGCGHITVGDANKAFRSYTHNLFCQEVASNTISLHYTLKDPSAYKIGNAPVTFGGITTDSDAISASSENAIAALHSFDRKDLSKENRITYDVLDNYFNAALSESEYILYDEPLSPLTGTQAQLPVLLSEFTLSNKEDVALYLKLLAQTPSYFESIINFEQAKSKAGLFMSERSADDISKECNAFIGMGDNNYLYSSFEERLNALNLSAEDYGSYISQNEACIKDYIFPAYKALSAAVTDLRSTGKNTGGLCHFPNGRTYYELAVKRETGSFRSIEEIKKLTQAQMLEDLTAMQKLLSASSEAAGGSTALTNADPSAILSELQTKLTGDFPAPPKVDTEIKYVQKSMEEYLSPAFYMVPAIDNTQENVIYLNEGHMPDDISLYTTLAHEGYPGHLYQMVYYQSLSPDPIRNLLGFGGYTEGWATYSEMLSYYYAPISKIQATLMQHNTSAILGIYALADIGIHYDGWNFTETASFFHQYGITNTETIQNIYDLIIGDPANYLKYYIGYVEFLELKKEAIDKWGEAFTQENFHRKVLEAGPAPFSIVREYVLGTK